MKRNLKFFSNLILTAGACLMFILAAVGAQAQDGEESQGFVVDKIVAKVDNYIVLKSEVDKAYLDYVTNQGGRGNPDEIKCQFLAILIRNKLMLAKAEIDSVVVTDDEVDANTERRIGIITSQYGDVKELEKAFGKTMEQIKGDVRDMVREQMIVSEMERTITKDLTVTPAEIKKFYNKIPKDSLPFLDAEAEVAQIVRVAKISQQQKEQTKGELLAIRDELLRGADFATLAKKYSADPSVATNGGDMGWSGRGRMVPEFEAMAFKLKPGEISMPFETDFGIHIMQLMERRGNEYHSRHILMSPSPSSEDLKVAEKYLDSLRAVIKNGKIKFQEAAKEYSDDMATKGNGGFFADENGGTKIPYKDLDPVVYFAIDSMKTGNVSKPLVYRTEDQKEAVRILFYKSKTAAHELSLKDDWNKLQTATLNEKKNGILNRWFNKVRQDVFISIDPSYNFCGILD
ncbi:MAG TPA: peptidylprolyl isomerase [Cyclobacteriaceae bacterium]|nr:peptidylprolyl isomerase [Cyclobacteriaceae bacterium]HMV89342.1 peptidylprolyl isomerase [Cyclobacteriaceae bacterium]HMW98748.1 peptidylprolyl isomerase [Cyclobacteriaceae bacterium]HMX48619.1 peptidylprolyl isomerase [Cyclobacteriaceae bacterium]HMY95424.1 peptidylprolyl isomerase [Cyclobacteriaceae bacterium]